MVVSTVGVRSRQGSSGSWSTLRQTIHAERVQAGSSVLSAKRASSPDGATSVAVSAPIQRRRYGRPAGASDSSTSAGSPMARRSASVVAGTKVAES